MEKEIRSNKNTSDVVGRELPGYEISIKIVLKDEL
jgi:hypothetical protein